MIKYRIRASIKATIITATKIDKLSPIKFTKFNKRKKVKQANNVM